ncbi:glycosyltransferase family 4 protein [Pontibacter sp. BT731]|uniref:glycosyltransferase family 4 protein n=1 Tax=Pontibacter coccineus TaxID=3063328 RepID=UPI0026E16451|nr:glycosyltransferase family 4 protein [Pontibacter sp. BT731]MDO6391146.1 glycosyltransferase family 4 protein [Pontibacter sp. BT731]
MKNRIFLVSNMYPSRKDPGYGIFVKNFERHAEKNGFVIVDKAVIEGKGISISQKVFKYIFFYYAIIAKGLRGDYDMIYAHYITHSALPLLLLRLVVNKPIVLNAHGDDVMTTSRVQHALQIVVKRLLKYTNLLVVPSNFFARKVRELYQIDERKIQVSPSGGVDTNLFSPFRKEIQDKVVIGYVSRIEESKGWRTFIKAISKLQHDPTYQNRFKALVVGDGSDKLKLLDELELSGLQLFVSYKGFIEQQKLPDVLNELDVLVFPTLLYESLGLVGLEAMACGVPVIGSRRGGLTDYIRESVNGFYIDPDDQEELYRKLVGFLSLSLAERKTLQANARSTALQYSSDTVSQALMTRLQTI